MKLLKLSVVIYMLLIFCISLSDSFACWSSTTISSVVIVTLAPLNTTYYITLQIKLSKNNNIIIIINYMATLNNTCMNIDGNSSTLNCLLFLGATGNTIWKPFMTFWLSLNGRSYVSLSCSTIFCISSMSSEYVLLATSKRPLISGLTAKHLCMLPIAPFSKCASSCMTVLIRLDISS